MEIADYLRIAKRRFLVLVGIPVLAAVLAVTYILAKPRPHVATVDVSAPSLMGSQYGTYNGAGAGTQFPSDFIAIATSPTVENAVARQTHVSVSDIGSGLSVAQLGTSSRVAITYTTRAAKTAVPVAVAVGRQTLTTMFASQVPIAQAAVRSAQTSLHAANKALADFTEKNGSIPVDKQYTTLTAQITALENEKAHDESVGLTYSANLLSDKINGLKAQAGKLAPLTSEQADLTANQAAAASTLTTSNQTLAQARAQLAAAGPGQLKAPPAAPVSLGHMVVTTVVPAAAVGLFLAIVLVALLELIAQRRPEKTRERRPAKARFRPRAGRLGSAFETVRIRVMLGMDKMRSALTGRRAPDRDHAGDAPADVTTKPVTAARNGAAKNGPATNGAETNGASTNGAAKIGTQRNGSRQPLLSRESVVRPVAGKD